MANSIVQPYPGPFVCDFQSLDGVVVDVVPGRTRGFRREKEGIAEVLAEIASGAPLHADSLGIAADAHTKIDALTQQITQVRAKRVVVDKAAEVLAETEVFLEDEREGQIGILVQAARNTARRKDPAVMATFEKTIQYHGQYAKRAHKTRRKNASAAAGAAAAAAPAPEALAPEASPAEAPEAKAPAPRRD